MPNKTRKTTNTMSRLEARLDRVDATLKLVLAELRSISLRLAATRASNAPIPPIVRAVGKRLRKSNEDDDKGIIF